MDTDQQQFRFCKYKAGQNILLLVDSYQCNAMEFNMSNESIIAGNIVKLQSGGPLMTVGDFVAGRGLRCFWFVNNQILHETFPPATLKLIEPADQEKTHDQIP